MYFTFYIAYGYVWYFLVGLFIVILLPNKGIKLFLHFSLSISMIVLTLKLDEICIIDVSVVIVHTDFLIIAAASSMLLGYRHCIFSASNKILLEKIIKWSLVISEGDCNISICFSLETELPFWLPFKLITI